MRAVVVEAFGSTAVLRQVPDPRCPPDGVVVAVEATGLCRSDWHGWMGHDADIALPHVPGHELAGTIVEVAPAVRRWAVGDRVTTPFVLACGHCRPCRRGDGQVCEEQLQPGFTLWGSFADLVALPRADLNLVRIPDDVSSDVAAALGCRFATAYRAVALVARVEPGEWLAVHGCGGVGLSAVMIGIALGARVLAVDPDPGSLALAESLGASAIPPTGVPEDVAPLIVELTEGGADVSLDAFGSRMTLAVSLACLRPRGRHVQVGLLVGTDAHPEVDMGRVLGGELQLLGSHGMAASDYPELLAHISNGTLDPARLLRDRIGLAETGPRLAALGDAGAGAGGITIVRPDLP
jgi:alcohol dehydrogenase